MKRRDKRRKGKKGREDEIRGGNWIIKERKHKGKKKGK